MYDTIYIYIYIHNNIICIYIYIYTQGAHAELHPRDGVEHDLRAVASLAALAAAVGEGARVRG